MKKKIITLSLAMVMLFLALAILTVLPAALQGERDPLPSDDGTRQILYDTGGTFVGCKAPGTAC